MNRLKLITVLLFWMVISAHAQEVIYPIKGDRSVVRIKEFYSGCGKIFNTRNFLTPENVEIILPNAEEILRAEQLLDGVFVNLVDSLETLNALRGKDYKEFYQDFYRQYTAFRNENGQKLIVIHLIKCCKTKIVRCFPDWKSKPASPLDEDQCTITSTYLVNLDNGKIIFN